jgi:hypothetical protein
LQWVNENKEKISPNQVLFYLKKINFFSLSDQEQELYLEIQSSFEKKANYKKTEQKDYEKLGLFSIPIEFIALRLEE